MAAGEDTDVFVLLVYWCKKTDVSCAVQMERWNGYVLDINATVAVLADRPIRLSTRDYWECTHFRGSDTISCIPLEEERCPPCEYLFKALLISVPLLRERTHLVECCQASNIPKEEEPASTEIAPPNRREPDIARAESPSANAAIYGRRQTSPCLPMHNRLIRDRKRRNMSM